MFEQMKKDAMNRLFRLMSHPQVTRLMSDPRFMNAISKGFELHGQIRTHLESKLRALHEGLNLASREEVDSIQHKLDQVESHVQELDQKLAAKARKPGSRKKKTTPPSPPKASGDTPATQ